MLPEELAWDEEGNRTGSRLGSSGWQIWGNVRLVRANESGVFDFDGADLAAIAPPRTKVSVVLDGQEIVGKQVPLDDDYLVRDGHLRGTERPTPTTLRDFLALGPDPSAESILAFAQRHGLLGLALTNRVRPATIRGWLPQLGTILGPTLGYRHAPGVDKEPLGLWRRVCREVNAVARIGAGLRMGQRADREAWVPLADVFRFPLRAEEVSRSGAPLDPSLRASLGAWVTSLDSDSLDDQCTALTAVLGAWMSMGAVNPAAEWTAGADRPFISLSVSSLFGGIVLELVTAVAGSAGIVLCSNCSMPFLPSRRPTARQVAGSVAIYCAACQEAGVPVNEASARWRSRNPEYFRNRHAKIAGDRGTPVHATVVPSKP